MKAIVLLTSAVALLSVAYFASSSSITSLEENEV